jgi:uncharacterized membrane protein
MRFWPNLSAPELRRRIAPLVNLFQGREGHSRSLAKAVSWRTVGTIDTFIIGFFVTGKVSVAGTIAAIEVVTKILIYYVHERVWSAVPWGHR